MVEKNDAQRSGLVEEKQGVTPTTYINPAVPAQQAHPEDKDAHQRGTKDKLEVIPGASNTNHEAADAIAQVSLRHWRGVKKIRR